jgi:hypothetical protein
LILNISAVRPEYMALISCFLNFAEFKHCQETHMNNWEDFQVLCCVCY